MALLTELAALIVFPSLMAYAAASDLLTMTISNRVSMALIGSFLAISLLSGVSLHDVLAVHLACGAAVLLLTFTLFSFGWIGGGDAKLAAATAVWLGWDNLFDYGLQASVLGAALTIGILYFRKYRLPPGLDTKPWLKRLHASGNGVPYGIALAVAGLALYPDTAVWTAVGAA